MLQLAAHAHRRRDRRHSARHGRQRDRTAPVALAPPAQLTSKSVLGVLQHEPLIAVLPTQMTPLELMLTKLPLRHWVLLAHRTAPSESR